MCIRDRLDHSRSSQWLPLRTFVVSTDITENRAFDEGNKCDFAASPLRAYLNGEFLRKLEDELGAGNICEYVIDLTADDGLPKYGKDLSLIHIYGQTWTPENIRRYSKRQYGRCLCAKCQKAERASRGGR